MDCSQPVALKISFVDIFWVLLFLLSSIINLQRKWWINVKAVPTDYPILCIKVPNFIAIVFFFFCDLSFKTTRTTTVYEETNTYDSAIMSSCQRKENGKTHQNRRPLRLVDSLFRAQSNYGLEGHDVNDSNMRSAARTDSANQPYNWHHYLLQKCKIRCFVSHCVGRGEEGGGVGRKDGCGECCRLCFILSKTLKML